MAKVVCTNPACQTVSVLPDEHLGRKVRCKFCQTVFVAAPMGSVNAAASVDGVTAVPPQADGGAVTVVARRVGGLRESAAPPPPPPPPARAGCAVVWLAVAALGFLLPVAGAGGYVALHWSRGRGGSVAVAPPADAGSLHAGIDIGSKGVKSVVLEVFPNAETGYDVEPQGEPETVNTTLVAGLAANGHFDADALADTARAVHRLYDSARGKYNVPEDHIYIVGSSGLFSALLKKKGMPEKDKADLVRAGKEALSQAVTAQVGKPVRFIDAADEAAELFKGIVPRPQAADAVMYDIGSGSTKGAYAAGPGAFTTLELPFGTKTFADYAQRELKKAGGAPGPAARRLAAQALRQPLHEQFERKPGFRSRERVYLSGGIVWAMTTYVHPEDRRAMVELKADDVDAFLKLLDRGRQAAAAECADRAAATVKDPAKAAQLRKEVAAEVKRVNDTFSPVEMRAGAAIIRAVSTEGELAGKKIYFARYGYFAWLLSYVQEKGAAQ